MRPSDKKVHNVIKKMFFKASPELNNDIWVETLRTHNEFHGKEIESGKQNVWRIIMKNNISKLSATAAILIGIMFLLSYNNNTGVVWGRVLSDMDKFPTIIYTSVSEPISAHPTEVKSTSKTYNAGENGYRVDMFMGNELVLQSYEIPKENSYYLINHGQKEYTHTKLSDQGLFPEDIPRPKPQKLVKDILSENYENIGKSEINGIIVEGVELKDSKLLYGKDTVIKLWVDVKTNLPVKIEYESTFFDEGVQIYARFRSIDENFEWNIELDPATFKPDIPSDYRENNPPASN